MPETDRPATPVVIKKYANRRLYDTESSIYITLDSLAAMVRQNRDFVVFDAKTGDDITRSVLTQIIVEEETKGRNMLPTVFLRQLIGFYGDSMQGLVPEYLEQMMEQFAARQRPADAGRSGAATGQKAPPSAAVAAEPAGRPSVPIIERARSLLTSVYRGGVRDEIAEAETAASVPDEEAFRAEIRSLRAEVDRLGRELARTALPAEASSGGGGRGDPGSGRTPD